MNKNSVINQSITICMPALVLVFRIRRSDNKTDVDVMLSDMSNLYVCLLNIDTLTHCQHGNFSPAGNQIGDVGKAVSG